MSKLLFTINNLDFGGAERLVVDDINEMVKRGIKDVYLITLKNEKKNSLSSECLLPQENWFRLNFKNFFSIREWVKFIKIVKSLQVQVIYSHLWFSNTIVRMSSVLFSRVKIVTFEHNVYDSVKNSWQFKVDRVLQSRSNKIVAVSSAVEKSLVRNGINHSKIIVVHNGIPISKYSSIDGGIFSGPGEFTFIFVGRLIHQKAPDILLEAFSRLGKGRLLFVGEGDLRKGLEQYSVDKRLTERVQFLGIVNTVPQLLAKSDCFVLPSRHEGLGIVVLEAMAAAKPVIISNFEAGRDIIENEKNGLVVRMESVQELEEAMNRIMEDRELRERLSASAQNRVKEFSIQAHVDRMLCIIKTT